MCTAGPTSRSDSPRVDEPVSFDPDARCCTYQPEIWNFLAGAALADHSAAGTTARASILARIAAANGVTPLGLGRSRKYAALYAAGGDGFGRSHALRCPHYVVEGSQCAIWRHRDATCATWFCKHEHGAVSKRFWDRLHQVLQCVELAVSRHAVLTLDIGEAALAALFPARPPAESRLSVGDLDDLGDPARMRQLWGRWSGRMVDFYIGASELSAALSWEQIRRLGGADLTLRIALLVEAHRELEDREIPERLRAPSFSVATGIPHAPGNVVLGTYSGYDPLEVPEVLVRCLPYFDGRPTRDALDAIETTLGVRLERGLVRRLLEFGVLTDEGDRQPRV